MHRARGATYVFNINAYPGLSIFYGLVMILGQTSTTLENASMPSLSLSHRCLVAQGDILVERIGDRPVSGSVIGTCGERGWIVIAEGEESGNRHRVQGSATLHHDECLARDVPRELYVGHLVVRKAARLLHEEHGPILLSAGTYCIRRQRRLEPCDPDFVED